MLPTIAVLLLSPMVALLGHEAPFTCAATVASIATFNIQNLGKKKVANPEVMLVLSEIFGRYDILLVQEVQDKSQTAVSVLNDTINAPCLVTVEKYGHYDDPQDVFTRDPFLTKIKFKNSNLPSLVLSNLHAKPDTSSGKATVQEINEQAKVYDFIRKEYGTQNAIFVGDMNSDGSYVKKRDWNDLSLRKDKRFHWIVPDGMDTTVGNSHNTYDRVIVAGDELFGAIVGTAQTYRFDNDRTMTMSQALQVSDHYPVEFKIRL